MRVAVLAILAALSAGLTGCNNGTIKLPDVNLTVPIVESVKLGPSTRVSPGVPIVDVAFELGEFCGIVDPDAIAAQIQDALGETAAGIVEVESITLNGVVFSIRSGSFSTFERLALRIAPKGAAAIPFGEISSNSGLGTGFTINADSPIDILALFKDTDCFSAGLSITGTTPAANPDMRLGAYVKVSSRVSVAKILFGR